MPQLYSRLRRTPLTYVGRIKKIYLANPIKSWKMKKSNVKKVKK